MATPPRELVTTVVPVRTLPDASAALSLASVPAGPTIWNCTLSHAPP